MFILGRVIFFNNNPPVHSIYGAAGVFDYKSDRSQKKPGDGFTEAESSNAGAARRELGACPATSFRGRKNARLYFAIR
jgi:hypothetical protein